MSENNRMIESVLYFSPALQDRGHLFLLRALRDWGGRFFYPGADDSQYEVEEFVKENPEERRFRFQFGNYFFNVSFMQQSPSLLMTSSATFVIPAKNEEAASTMATLVERIWALLSFRYGFVDIYPDIPNDKSISGLKLPYIFWLNLFGQDYVAKLGKDFLLRAPGKTTELADGAIKYMVAEQLFGPRDKKLDQAIAEYFAPKVKTKRHVPIPDKW